MYQQHYQLLFGSRKRRRFSASMSLFCIVLLASVWANAAQVENRHSKWSTTGSLGIGRFGHTSTLLADGKVLVAGGVVCVSGCTEFRSAEVYDPATGAWDTNGDLTVPRRGHVAVRLPSGVVLVAGGRAGTSTWNTAELFDPDTGVWSVTGNLSSARAYATAVLLQNGQVLVAGGLSASGASLDTAELFDPATGLWSATGRMSLSREFHTATLLLDGRVLVAGGYGLSGATDILRAAAELYDPASGRWTTTGSLSTARFAHTSTLLASGKVLVTGGNGLTSASFDTAELYDPASGLWSATGKLTIPRSAHTATLLANGEVLAVAGFNNDPVDLVERSAERYDPATETWTPTASLNDVRANHGATLLADGRVLVSGGRPGESTGLVSSELFDYPRPVPQITGVSITGIVLFVEGLNFDDRAKLFLNDKKQKTAIELPATLLRCKKAGKKIEPGETVMLKVRNSDGTESAEFMFVRPVE